VPSTARDSFVINPNIYALKLCSVYKIQWHPDSFVYWDSIIGLRADALVPCFLLAPRLFRRDTKLRCHLSGLVTF
jgi:hypothetical protein